MRAHLGAARCAAMLLLAVNVGACREYDCTALCRQARRCQNEVAGALAASKTGDSAFLRYARAQAAKRMGQPVTQTCALRCERKRGGKRWQREVGSCTKHRDCRAFARCVKRLFEP